MGCTAAVDLHVHLQNSGVMHQTVDGGQGHGRLLAPTEIEPVAQIWIGADTFPQAHTPNPLAQTVSLQNDPTEFAAYRQTNRQRMR